MFGVFSPTEASAVGVGIALILGVFVYKELTISALPRILWESGRLTSAVMILVACAAIFSWTLSIEEVPAKIADVMLHLTNNKYIFLLYINLLLLVIGTFMDITASTLILTPILLPVAEQFGVDPVHFGLIMVLNLVIGVRDTAGRHNFICRHNYHRFTVREGGEVRAALSRGFIPRPLNSYLLGGWNDVHSESAIPEMSIYRNIYYLLQSFTLFLEEK